MALVLARFCACGYFIILFYFSFYIAYILWFVKLCQSFCRKKKKEKKYGMGFPNRLPYFYWRRSYLLETNKRRLTRFLPSCLFIELSKLTALPRSFFAGLEIWCKLVITTCVETRKEHFNKSLLRLTCNISNKNLHGNLMYQHI